MMRLRGECLVTFLSVCLLAGMGGRVSGQYSAQHSLEMIKAPSGLQVQTFASEPMIINPISVDVDFQGRLWVTEGVNYRKNVKVPPDNTLKVLEDTDKDGVADKVTVFTSDLNASMSVCVAGDRIYVAESPNIYVYEDKDHDLKPDGPRKIFLTGFGGKNHDHGVHGLTLGPDHKLYMTCGDSGFDVTGPDGVRIHFRWGAMIRCELDGTKLEAFAVNFRNPFELAVDSWGHVWCSDNDNDGLKSVRICWILEGGNYGWFGGPERIQERDGSFLPIHHWRADQPGFVPYTKITGFGSPSGMTFNEGDGLGSDLKGKILHCDPGPRELREYRPMPLHGMGYAIAQENILTSKDAYFRPIDVCIAPDGALYVTDWYDGGVGGHNYNDPTRGRIYKVSAKDQKLVSPNPKGEIKTLEEAIQGLSSPNLATAYLSRTMLLAGGSEGHSRLLALARDAGTNEMLRARALWLLDRIGGEGRAEVAKLLQGEDGTLRALAVRILRRHGAEYAEGILKLADDKNHEVQTEVLLACRTIPGAAAEHTILAFAKAYDGSDRYLLEAIKIAAQGRESKLIADLNLRDQEQWDDRSVRLLQVLQGEKATETLIGLLPKPGLTEQSQLAVARGVMTSPKPEAGKAIVELLARTKNPELQKVALEALRQRLSVFWNDQAKNPELETGLVHCLQEPSTRIATCHILGQVPGNLKQVRETLLGLVKQEGLSKAEEIELLKVCTQLRMEETATLGQKLLQSQDEDLRKQGIATFAALGDIRQLQSALHNPLLSAAVKQQILSSTAERSEGGVLLLRLVEMAKLPDDLKNKGIQLGTDHPDAHVRMLFAKYLPPEKRPKTLGQEYTPEEILGLKGDAMRGARIFNQGGSASCSKCHRIEKRGADIGPNLSQIGKKYERKALLETIVNPSAAIAPEYYAYVVQTKAGKVHAGFLQQSSDQQVVLKTIEGEVVTIPRDDVEELIQQKISLMPDAVLKDITAQDAADLLEYLTTLK
ncbi:MAG: PVC-type heme-binding CxxCH protein [Planctomycetales bacterium]